MRRTALSPPLSGYTTTLSPSSIEEEGRREARIRYIGTEMLSVIITPGDPRRLPALLAALTTGAVAGLIGDVVIVGSGPLIDALCEDTGAERADSYAAAVLVARSDRLLVMPPAFRPRDGWLETLDGGATALRGRGLFAPRALLKQRLPDDRRL